MTVTTNERGQQNIFAKEPQVKVMEVSVTHNEKAEQLNGRTVTSNAWAELLQRLVGAYCTDWSGNKNTLIC